jgi:signal transduction histidine kinase/CheY-like chemotaxis protein
MKIRATISKLHFQILAPLLTVLVLFVFAFGYMAWVISNRFSTLQQELSASTKATRSLLEIAHLRGDSKEILLLYRLTRDTKYLAELNETEMERSLASNRLEQEVKDIEPNQVLFESFFSGAREARDLRQSILDSIASQDEARTTSLFETYDMLYQMNSARLTDLHAATRGHLAKAENKMRSLIQQLPVLLIGMIALGIAGAWLMVRFYRARVLRPLSILHNAIGEVAKGRLENRLPIIPAPAEIQDMTYGFNTMTSQLEKTRLELTEAREVAMRAANVKSEFLANMSHEIRTPLNVIVGIADLMHERPLDPETQNEIDVLKKSSGMLLEIVNDILDYSRLESGQVTLSQEPFDLREAIESVAAMIEPLANAKNLALGVQISSEVPQTIVGDSQRLKQALLNLANNAVKFTAEGSVTIIAKALVSQTGPKLELAIRDTGIGVPTDKIEMLFTRFTQANTSITRTHGGTGLGLAIVKQITSLFKGEVEVDSTLGSGSVFTMRIPIQLASESTYQVAINSKNIAAFSGFCRPPRILLADDSMDNRFLIKSYLKNTGARIVEAQNGREAVQSFSMGEFDIVLMDIQMPEVDGHQATREIRNLESNSLRPRTPVVALTAFAMKEEIERCLANGCDAHMAKPIRKVDLLRSIESYLKISETSAELKPERLELSL